MQCVNLLKFHGKITIMDFKMVYIDLVVKTVIKPVESPAILLICDTKSSTSESN